MKKMVVPRKIEWIGGTEPDEKVPLVVKPASDEATITTTESITEPVAEQAVEPASEEPISEPVPEPVSEPVAEELVPEPVEEPIPEPVSEPVEQPVSEPVPEPIAEAVTKPVEEPIVAENVNPVVSSGQPSVADALNLIADKIATAVVIKMRESPATGSISNQDADIAVPLAINAVVKQTQLAPE